MSQVPLRFSRLRLMSRSAAHYAAHVETEETPSMETGTAADRLILGGGRVLVYPGPVRRGHQYDAFVEENPGALIVTKKEGDQALGIAEAVAKCHDATRLLTGVRRETLFWDFSGRECRGTPDVRGAGFITDLKTGETSDPRFFPFKVRRFAYHAQMAFYEQGCNLLGHDVSESYIVSVEQAPPHVVTVYRLTPNLIELGDRLWRLWFEQLLVCEASQAWPGYSQSIVDLDLPDEDQVIDIGSAELVETTAGWLARPSSVVTGGRRQRRCRPNPASAGGAAVVFARCCRIARHDVRPAVRRTRARRTLVTAGNVVANFTPGVEPCRRYATSATQRNGRRARCQTSTGFTASSGSAAAGSSTKGPT